jgi:hypothetical protein
MYQFAYQSMHFLFKYIENTKKIGILHWLVFFVFETLSLAYHI